MTRPYAPTITKTKPVVDLPPVVERPTSPFGGAVSPFTGTASPFTASAFAPTASPFGATRARPDSNGVFRARNPFRAPPSNRRTHVRNRRRIILPNLGHREPPRGNLFWLALDELYDLYDMEPGGFFTPGCGNDFTEDAVAAVTADDGECNYTLDGACIDDGETHMHPLLAADYHMGSGPAGWCRAFASSEASEEVMPLWRQFSDLFAEYRAQLLADPGLILEDRLYGPLVAVKTLDLTGFMPGDGGMYAGELLCDLVSEHLEDDATVRDAFADFGVLRYGGQIEAWQPLAPLFEQMAEYWVEPIDPVYMQLLSFDPEHLPDLIGKPNGLTLAPLLGDWICTEGHYRSCFADGATGDPALPFTVGWYQAVMTPVSKTEH